MSFGLLADRISPSLVALAVRLAARMSFAEARDVFGWFVPSVPSLEVIQAATLGYGRYSREWFESAPAPEDDGQVLSAQLDSKGAPTATERELAARRGKRNKKRGGKSGSPQDRGRLAGASHRPRDAQARRPAPSSPDDGVTHECIGRTKTLRHDSTGRASLCGDGNIGNDAVAGQA
jgi:hypothetical protein